MRLLSETLKEETQTAHQRVERIVIKQIKEIDTKDDYINLLNKFYAFYKGVEDVIFPYLEQNAVASELCSRRSSMILDDLKVLGQAFPNSQFRSIPIPQNFEEALVAQYVLEGSSLGGRYIAQMLQKKGIQEGLTFFLGDKEDFMSHWQTFKNFLNAVDTVDDFPRLIDFTNAVFTCFGLIMDKNYHLEDAELNSNLI